MGGGPQEVALRQQIEEHKKTYMGCMDRLKQVKAEIEQYKHNNEINKQRLQKDFEAWYTALQASQGGAAPQMTQASVPTLDSARYDTSATTTRPPPSGGQAST